MTLAAPAAPVIVEPSRAWPGRWLVRCPWPHLSLPGPCKGVLVKAAQDLHRLDGVVLPCGKCGRDTVIDSACAIVPAVT